MQNLLYINIVGKGEPLVLLHGWGWHSGIWSTLIPHLADKFQLFIPDLPGFGKSTDFTKEYTFEEISQALFKQLPSEAIWLGWSLGGLLAWWIAIHYPEKVSKLITVAASPKFTSDDKWPGVSTTNLNRFSAQLNDHYEETLIDFLRLQLRGDIKNKVLFSELKKQLLPMQSSALRGGLRLLSETDLRCDLHKIKISALHIFGGMDTLVPANVVASLEPLLGSGQCEIMKRAGHIPFLSHQDEFLEILRRFKS